MIETVEHNNKFYGEELKTESEQLKEWLVIANKENERLLEEKTKYVYKEKKLLNDWHKINNENIHLHSIIKEVREYIDRYEINSIGTPLTYTQLGKELLEILDKAGDSNERNKDNK